MGRKTIAILNCYRRPDYLEEQIQAVREQSVPPDEVWLWVNGHPDNEGYRFETLGLDKVVRSSHNFRYHARFALGLLAEPGSFLAYFDDDTIPGSRWLENCQECFQKQPGIYGGVGVILRTSRCYPHDRVGWPTRNAETTRVDFAGHAWYLDRSCLNLLWYANPLMLDNAEDVQLSFTAKLYGGVNTYCPPHPAHDESLWSSTKGRIYGEDDKASCKGGDVRFREQRDRVVAEAIRLGWETVRG